MSWWLRLKARLRSIGPLYRAYALGNVALKHIYDFASLHKRDVLDRETFRTRYASSTRQFDAIESIDFSQGSFTLHASRDVSFREMLKQAFVFDVPSVTRLKNAEVVGNCGVILTAEGDIVLESTLFTLHYYRRSWDSRYVLLHRRLEAERVDGPVISLLSPLSRIYFHWMAECLPRLFALQTMPTDVFQRMTFLVNKEDLPFQRQSLQALFGIEASQIRTRATLRTCVEELYVPTYRHLRPIPTRSPDIYSFRVFQQMRDLHRSRVQLSAPSEFILLLRRKGTHREIINADEFLKRFPLFQPVYAERLSITEQLRLFACARAIVAVHGSGLTNTMFCPPRCIIIELYPKSWDFVNSLCYLPISWANNLDHHIVEVDIVPTFAGPLTENVRLSEGQFQIIASLLEKTGVE